MLKINFSSPVPLYEQLVEEIKRMIADGEIKPGDSLPPVRRLASQLDIAVNTVARAYQELRKLELIEGSRRKGSFVQAGILEVSDDDSRAFKETILKLIQKGMNRTQIESIFKRSLSQIFD